MPGRLSLIIVVLCMLYGICMGSFSLVSNQGAKVQFFRAGSWSNAYEVVIQMMWDVVR